MVKRSEFVEIYLCELWQRHQTATIENTSETFTAEQLLMVVAIINAETQFWMLKRTELDSIYFHSLLSKVITVGVSHSVDTCHKN